MSANITRIENKPPITGAGDYIVNVPPDGWRHTVHFDSSNVTEFAHTFEEDPATATAWKNVDLTQNDVTDASGNSTVVIEADITAIRFKTSGAVSYWARITRAFY